MKTAAAFVVLAGWLLSCGLAGHADMFSCRSKACPVEEITDANFDQKLASEPHFVMFYAPWCGHCKQLAPKLKKAAKILADMGVKVGAVDVEPNRGVQSKFPDIRGFPTLKFLPGPNPRKSVDYNGAREVEAIVEFSKQQAESAGVTLNEPVVVKAHKDLFTFFGRAALDRKPAVLLVGAAGKDAHEPPAWLGKVAADLRLAPPDLSAESPEARTRELLKEAAKASKVAAVKEGVRGLLDTLDKAERTGSVGPPVVTPGYATDPETVGAFGLSSSDLPALFVAAVDRKTGQGQVLRYPGSLSAKRIDTEPIVGFLREALPHTAAAEDLAAFSPDRAAPLPAFPKPPSVIAAEQRAAARRAEEGSVSVIDSQAVLDRRCYALDSRTCALVLVRGGGDPAAAAAAAEETELTTVAKKFARDGFTFSVVDADAAPGLAATLVGGEAALASAAVPKLAVVKGGRRPRVALSAEGGVAAFTELLDSVVAGGAQFSRLADGLPSWPAQPADGVPEDEVEEMSGFSEDEL